jgi:uncharacterized damage-inducible protein DinB
MQRPLEGEYNPYYQRYIDLVSEGTFSEIFAQTTSEAISFFENIPSTKHNYRYAENKWTIKDVFMHIIDTERVMAYRALVVARGDTKSVLPYMEEDEYAANVDVTNRPMESLIAEFRALRTASQLLLESLTAEQSQRVGIASGHAITPRALAYIMTGHILHHNNVIQSRYL